MRLTILRRTRCAFAFLLLLCCTPYSVAGDKDGVTANEVYNFVEGATLAIYFHELGHAFVDIFDFLPVGDQESVADEFAGMLMMSQAGSGAGFDMLDAFVDFIAVVDRDVYLDGEGRLTQRAFTSLHSMGPRRAFSVLCLFYGEYPDRVRDDLVARGADQRRLEQCTRD